MDIIVIVLSLILGSSVHPYMTFFYRLSIDFFSTYIYRSSRWTDNRKVTDYGLWVCMP